MSVLKRNGLSQDKLSSSSPFDKFQPAVKIGIDRDGDEEQVAEVVGVEDAYDTFVANTRIVVDCLLMLRGA